MSHAPTVCVGGSGVTRRVHALSMLGVIGVPVVGWFVVDWSAVTTLVVYWFETLAASLFIVARIALHQRWSPRLGHFRYQPPRADGRAVGRSSFIAGFTLTSVAFCCAHGVFLAVLVLGLSRNHPGQFVELDWHDVVWGCVTVLAFLALDFGTDLLSLRRWSFRDVELTAQRAMSRIVVVHLTLILGFFGIVVLDAPAALFGVFVVLKSLAALSLAVPQWEPAVPPQWLSRILNRLTDAQPGHRFEDDWADDRRHELSRQQSNERAWVSDRC